MDDILTIEVSLTDLEVWRGAFNSALHQNIVIDLAEQYRRMSQRPQPSPMTKSLEGSLAGVDQYVIALKEAAENKESDNE